MGKKKTKKVASEEGILIVENNKKARRDYEIIDTSEVGIVLKGSEVKSIREGAVNLKESYVRIIKGELYLVGCHISPYSHAPSDAHKPNRDKKLLAHRKEIDRLDGKVLQKGLTLVPLKLYFKKGRCKLEIGVVRGKKLYDKREDLKEKAVKREMQRVLKG